MSRRRFEVESLKNLVKAIFEKKGLSAEKSADVADVMLAADSMGIESHGIQRMWIYTQGLKIGRIDPKAEISVVHESPVSAVLDANDGMGHPAAIKGMKIAIEKAGKTGMGMVTVRNSNHFGIGGYYSMLAAKEGLMGVCMTNSEAMVVPTFGRRAMLGTNPIAVSMPADPIMYHFDIATSVVPAGKIEVYSRNKQMLPEGWSVGSNGKANTDPDVFLKIRKEKLDGGLLPIGGYGTAFGGHKGYAISMLVELMTGIFAGGRTSNHIREVPNVDKCCHMFQVVDYGMFGDKKEIKAAFSKYLQEIRDSAKAEGHDRVYTQGEAEHEALERTAAEGIPLHDKGISDIMDVCKECEIDFDSIAVEKKD